MPSFCSWFMENPDRLLLTAFWARELSTVQSLWLSHGKESLLYFISHATMYFLDHLIDTYGTMRNYESTSCRVLVAMASVAQGFSCQAQTMTNRVPCIRFAVLQ
ncbi:hypothetical protein PSENEW3_00003373 [Picochlorum sp. SENEW3]|nr:hypothetical protein PSENEW3_00003373 [Picochlorum sp. SENEW3]